MSSKNSGFFMKTRENVSYGVKCLPESFVYYIQDSGNRLKRKKKKNVKAYNFSTSYIERHRPK